ncbi:MAG: DHH family phosphoesterase, partial [Thermoplasmatota archaeon]
MAFEELQKRAVQAAAVVRAGGRGRLWLIACDTDADGLCAAAVTAQALARSGQRFLLRASREKGEAHYRALCAETFDGLVTLDKGTNHAMTLGQNARGRPILVIDHHNLAPMPENVLLVNPRGLGLDGGTEASAATTAAAFALALVGEDALAWVGTALAGAWGDGQAPWQGWNRHLWERALAAGAVRQVDRPHLPGASVLDAIAVVEPALEDREAWLAGIGIEPACDPEDLSEEERTRLVSARALLRLSAGLPANAETLVAPEAWHARLGVSLRQVARMADACGRRGEGATGVGYLLGDPAAREDAKRLLAEDAAALQGAVAELAKRPPQVRGGWGVVWVVDAALSGTIADRLAHSKPVVVLARRPDGLVQASLRVPGGVPDAGRAATIAAQAAGGEGGG